MTTRKTIRINCTACMVGKCVLCAGRGSQDGGVKFVCICSHMVRMVEGSPRRRIRAGIR